MLVTQGKYPTNKSKLKEFEIDEYKAGKVVTAREKASFRNKISANRARAQNRKEVNYLKEQNEELKTQFAILMKTLAEEMSAESRMRIKAKIEAACALKKKRIDQKN